MPDRRYKKGVDREQVSFLPPRVEDYVGKDNPVRAIDAYVNSLDLSNLGFINSDSYRGVGQPAFSPATLLKLYLWGYLNRVRSSRRLEQECKRNLELIWLTEGLTPCYHSIANFRKNNHNALRNVNRQFVLLCKSLNLFGNELIALDSAYLEGNASRRSVYTKGQIKSLIKAIDDDIERYIGEVNRLDRIGIQSNIENLEDKLNHLEEQKELLRELEEELQNSGQKQLSLTDPDARHLTKRTAKSPVIGYTVQSVVDSKNKLIAVSEVVVDSTDSQSLVPILEKAKETLEAEEIIAVVDSGYYSNEGIAECEEKGTELYMPLPDKGKAKRRKGMFERADFRYSQEEDCYYCPSNEKMPHKNNQIKRGQVLKGYFGKHSVCKRCLLKQHCLEGKAKYRIIYRGKFEGALERHKFRMRERGPDMMRRRSGLAEHPFGTIKLWLGSTHFLVRGLSKVQGEMALVTTAYNFKRVLNILGVEKFITACTA